MTEDRHDAQIRDLVAELAASAPPPPPFSRIADRMNRTAGGPRAVLVADSDERHDAIPPYVTEAPSRAKPWRFMAAFVAFALATAGGVFAYGSLSGNDGASTPERAVEQFIDAFTQSDVAGMLEALAPEERVVLRESLESLNGQAGRLGLTKGLDLHDVSGVHLQVTGLALSSSELGQDVASVQIGGTLRSSADDRALPIGGVARQLLVDSLPNGGYQGVADAVDEAVNGNDVRLVTVREGGGWHVSVWYTVAEYLRKNSQAPRPDFGHSRIAPLGADSPEGALKALLDTHGDLAKAVALTTPDESRVLYDYVPVFADRRFTLGIPDYRVNQLRTHVVGDGDRRIVHIDAYDISYTYDTSEGSADTTAVRETFDGNCFSTTSTTAEPSGSERTCRADALARGASPLAWDLTTMFQVTAERHNGRWFLSPVRSLVDSTVARLARVPDGPTFTTLTASSDESSSQGFLLLPWDVISLAFGGFPSSGLGVLASSSVASSSGEASVPTTTAVEGTPPAPTATTRPVTSVPAAKAPPTTTR